MAWLAALLLAGVAAGGPAGEYRLVGTQDVASALRLAPDGRFQYFLAAGALDERAEGRWSQDGNRIRLTTEPKPVPPVFTQTASATSKDAPLAVRVVWPDGRGIAGVDVRVGFDRGAPVEGYTQDYGWSLPRDEQRTIRWIEFAVPMHALASPRFPVDPMAGTALTFVLTPNDLGVVDFADIKVDFEPGRLTVHRFGDALRYERVAD